MKKKIALLSLTTLLLTGCASTGNPSISALDSAQVATMINNGKTTKADIRAQFGDPSNVDFNQDGSEKWSYRHKKSAATPLSFVPIANTFAHGSNDTTKELIVLFDENDLVKKHAFSTSMGETKFGILG
ncbi:MAG: hypothetical protein BGO43_13390 [Gammaproteobacteria bacterium 39-13]|nr:hypothetical protein [Gammaproteobacteria bacterium]OJV85719.1 MAG: hypothetical protein BGO43_13390 [Gammaproteobacteria bacterium 39-13]